MRLDLKENIVFSFRDPSWPLKMLCCLVSLLPPFTPAFAGYLLATIRGAARGKADGLPDWSNPFDHWWEGLKFLCGLGLNLMVGFALMTGIGTAGALAYGDGSTETTGTGVALLMLAVAVFLGWSMLVMLFLPAIALRWAMTGEIGSFFNLPALLLDIHQSVPDFLMIVLFPVVPSMLLSLIGLIPGLGWLVLLLASVPLQMVTMLIAAHMLGNFFRIYFDEA